MAVADSGVDLYGTWGTEILAVPLDHLSEEEERRQWLALGKPRVNLAGISPGLILVSASSCRYSFCKCRSEVAKDHCDEQAPEKAGGFVT